MAAVGTVDGTLLYMLLADVHVLSLVGNQVFKTNQVQYIIVSIWYISISYIQIHLYYSKKITLLFKCVKHQIK